MHRQKVMIAGIGGASLGTEIFKALRLAGEYDIYGCDISALAYGLYEDGFSATYKVDENDYIGSVIEACVDSGSSWVIPGGEQPMVLLAQHAALLREKGICVVSNADSVVALCSDKHRTFSRLAECQMVIPKTVIIVKEADVRAVGLPCIVKPATNSGGSVHVFFAVTESEAIAYADLIRRNGAEPLAQEYVGISEGEFTIGVLSLPDGRIASTVALRRSLDAKLSLSMKERGGVISSGYSQGYIDEFPDLCKQAETIAEAVGSRGPLNIQGRVRDGVLLPFEINPRFSASTYLRALAGCNEADAFLRYLVAGVEPSPCTLRAGWYLRSLSERYVSEDQLK